MRTLLVICCLLISSSSALAQRGGEIVQLLLTSKHPAFLDAAASAKKSLNEHGYRVASPILVSKQDAALPKGAKLCLAIGTPAATWALRRADADATVAYCLSADPEAANLNEDPRAIGLSTMIAAAEQLELAKQLCPELRGISVLYRSSDASSMRSLKELRAAAGRSIGIHAVDLDVHRSSARAIKALFARRTQLIWSYPNRRVYSSPVVQALLLASVRRGVPAFGYSPSFVKAGAAFGVGVDPKSQGERAAKLLIERLRQRQRGRPLPPQGVVELAKLLIAVNYKVCRQLQLRIPKTWQGRVTWAFGK